MLENLLAHLTLVRTLDGDRKNSCAMETMDERQRRMKEGKKFVERISVRSSRMPEKSPSRSEISHITGYTLPTQAS